jgi:hypothetical protein
VGAFGIVNGVTEDEAIDGELVPELLVAATENVYAVPLVSPVTVHDDPWFVEHVRPSGVEVTR